MSKLTRKTQRNFQKAKRDIISVGASILFVLVLVGSFVPIFGEDSNPEVGNDSGDRSYSISALDINAQVTSDGLVHVKETRTFDFNGPYTGVVWEMGGAQGVKYYLNDVGIVQDDGSIKKVVPSELENLYREQYDYSSDPYFYLDNMSKFYEGTSSEFNEITVRFDAEDEKKTFVLEYVIAGGPKRYLDTSDFYWQFIGDGWEVPAKNVTVKVSLPEKITDEMKGNEVKIWGHGRFQGDVKFADDGTIIANIDEVPAFTFAELRAVFPEQWLSELEPIQANELDSILAEEQKIIDDWNRELLIAKIKYYGVVGGILLLGVGLFIFSIYAAHKYGRELDTSDFPPYEREVPPVHPAIASFVWENEKVTAEALSATIMRLIDNKVIDIDTKEVAKKGIFGNIRGTRTETTLSKNPNFTQTETLDPVDAKALDLLFKKFGTGDQLVMDQIEVYAKENPRQFKEDHESWVDLVESEASKAGLYGSTKGDALSKVIVVSSIVLLVLAILGNIYVGFTSQGLYYWIAFALYGVMLLATFILGHFTKRRTDEEATLVGKLTGLKRWLEEFTLIDESLPKDVKIWNQYLIFAVVLNVADKVMEQLEKVLPQVLTPEEDGIDAYPSLYSIYHLNPYMMYEISDSYDRAHTAAIAEIAKIETSGSTGSGGGGGFSGGGGGGFGGGGGRAF